MNIIDRAKNILLSPKTEWYIIETEPMTVNTMLTGYVIPLSLLPAAMALLSGLFYLSIGFGIASAVVAIITAIINFYVSTYVIDALATSFNSTKNINRSAQLAGYSYTANAVASILTLIPVLGGIAVFAGAAYAVYIMYLGIGPMKKTPEDKQVIYVIVIIIVQLVIYFILASLFTAVVFRNFSYL